MGNQEGDKVTTEQIISVLAIYQGEWEHRDNFMRIMEFALFYASLIVGLIPFLQDYIEVELSNLIRVVLPIVGLALSVFFVFVEIAYSARLEASSETVQKMIDQLPEKLKRVKVEQTKLGHERFVKQRIGLWMPLCMFVFLFTLNAVSLAIVLAEAIPSDVQAFVHAMITGVVLVAWCRAWLFWMMYREDPDE